jgi:hypothetical protein
VRLGDADGNNLKPAFVDRDVLESVTVSDGRFEYRARVHRRVHVVDAEGTPILTLPPGLARLEPDGAIRVKLAGGGVDYLEAHIPVHERDDAVTAALILAAVHGNPDRDVDRTVAVGAPYLALVRGEDPSAAWRRYPRVVKKQRKPLAERVRRLHGHVAVRRARRPA